MLQSQRFSYILRELDKNGTIHVKDIATELDISESTIRRDLINLEKEGKLNRVHGGAILGDGMSIYNESREIQIQERTRVNQESKLLVATEAAKRIKDHQCVFIDGGSSLAFMADLLADRDISIVTNSVLFLQRLMHGKASVYCLGGAYLDKFEMTMGPMAADQLAMFNFDAAFISCSGISFERGMSYTAEVGTNVIKQQAMKQSLHSYLLLDDSKIEMVGFCSIAPLEKYTAIFCNKVDDVESSTDNMIWI